jgi:uncharacterized protein (UPF0371 family)
MKIGFDNKRYVKIQQEEIEKRVSQFDGKLYLELGGKIFDDQHASRVLPGFEPDAKIQVLKKLSPKLEIIICANANDVEKRKKRADNHMTYAMETLRLIDRLRETGFKLDNAVITLYDHQKAVPKFKKQLEEKGVTVYLHVKTKGYPNDINTVVSKEGYGKNPYVKTDRPIVLVVAPGPGSGKLATCLTQLYHEAQMGRKAGYAKYETFPTWNLPLTHPVNIAYAAATADLQDVNMVDHFHLEAYGKTAVNYNRDLEVFPVLKRILRQLLGSDIYKSPTDMGVNMVKEGITDYAVVEEASRQEVVRRYDKARAETNKGAENVATMERLEVLLAESELTTCETYA